ncbi:MAG: ectoine hydroxylase-related dioxygenase (phytanoyl-CoA dioxygenase family), partial [Crocinitomicaceae bacterium]
MEVLELHNSELTETLRSEGKVVFPLLSAAQVDKLKAIFHEHHSTTPEGFYATTHREDKQFRKDISNQILAVIEEDVDATFKNLKMLGGAFISKAPGEKGILPLHQDWNIVNEKEARSYNLWIPLVDVNPFNGAIR